MLKPHLSGKSDVWKNVSLVFEKRHDVHDSASRDSYVLWLCLRVGSVGSGQVQELRKLADRVG